jgi:hypothetical protein
LGFSHRKKPKLVTVEGIRLRDKLSLKNKMSP